MDSLPTSYVDELHAMWEARNSITTPTTSTTNGKPTDEALKAKSKAIRQRHAGIQAQLVEK